MRSLKGLIFFVVLIIITSCGKNQYKVDISRIQYDVDLKRLETDLFELDPALPSVRLDELHNKYGEILQLFSYVIDAGDIHVTGWQNKLRAFLTDKNNFEIYSKTSEVFSDITLLESDLRKAWRHFKYYFPDDQPPEIFTFISAFRNSIIIGESVLGIGLDRYLGERSNYYPMIGLYGYQVRKMIPEKIVSDCMYAWALATWPADENIDRERNLIESMIYEGKLLYFTKCMLPNESDSLLFGFTGIQMEFCESNEDLMWEYLLENDMLFSTDPMTIKKLTGEAPFTGYFSNESPGRAAVWLGFKIAESYMIRNREVTLNELMEMDDYQLILEGARYSPSGGRRK